MVKIEASDWLRTNASRLLTPPADGAVGLGQYGDRYGASEQRSRWARLSGDLARTMRERLTGFADALDRFGWPKNADSLFQSRIAVPDRLIEQDVAQSIGAQVRPTNDVDDAFGENEQRYYKFFSSGFRGADAASSGPLPAGDYSFSMELGDYAETIRFSVASTDVTVRNTLDRFVDAVNAADLPVQAQRIEQSAANQKVQGLSAVGSSVALTVNPAYAAQDLTIQDGTGNPLAALDFTATNAPVTPATPVPEGRYDTRVATPFQAGSTTSRAFDPGATNTLATGDYTFQVRYADIVRDYTVGVATDGGDLDSSEYDLILTTGDTWEEVLDSTSRLVRNTAPGLDASTQTVTRPYYDPDNGMLQAERYQLTVDFEAPKTGERLSLSDTSGDLLGTLGLGATPRPGSDATFVVNGEARTAAPGTISQDQGRLTLTSTGGSFAEAAPVRVQRGEDAIPAALDEVLTSYNLLVDLFDAGSGSRDLFRSEVTNSLTGPQTGRQDALANIGIQSEPGSARLRFDPARFTNALQDDYDGVAQLLADSDSGLIAQWRRAVDDALDKPDSAYIIGPGALQTYFGSRREALENDFRALISNVIG